jgi:hypothetical protein
VSSLERRCRGLLRAYPAWYRRGRGEEMLGTLLEASPPGRRWPSFRDTRALVIGGLRVRGWTWLLSMLWVGLGAAYSIYTLVLSAHLPVTTGCGFTACWVGEPGMIIIAAKLVQAVWLLLTIPVLAAGLVRLHAAAVRAGAWAGAWAGGVALMIWAASWQTSAPGVLSCDKSGCILTGYRYSVVSWDQLPICASFLALGIAITLILARPADLTTQT